MESALALASTHSGSDVATMRQGKLDELAKNCGIGGVFEHSGFAIHFAFVEQPPSGAGIATRFPWQVVLHLLPGMLACSLISSCRGLAPDNAHGKLHRKQYIFAISLAGRGIGFLFSR